MLRGQNCTDLKRFELKTLATFEGTFIIDANSEEEARTIFDKNCRMGMLRDPMTDDDDAVFDYSVDMHPSKEEVVSVSILPKS